MGTTLTGTTPQDTYDSLIKVTDNGPLSGTAKYLSDGLGNDSALAVSTGAAGVGTTTLTRKFNIDGGSITSDTPTLRISSTDGSGTRKFGIEFFSNNGADVRGKLLADNNGRVYLDDNGGGGVVLQANGGTGNVGIGTSNPAAKLHVAGENIIVDRTGGDPFVEFYTGGTTNNVALYGGASTGLRAFVGGAERIRVTTNGLTFNGDAASANALDDYEEGTWTMGVSFGGASVGVTSVQGGTYTKIGRQVTVNGNLSLTNKGTSTGDALITGLPFTIANTTGNRSAASVYFYNLSFADQLTAEGVINTTTIALSETTNAGSGSNINNSDFANNTVISISFTYFV